MLSTGFPVLDAALLGGLHSGRMYLLASRSQVGKSTLAKQIATTIAENQKHVLFFSIEDTADSFGRNLVPEFLHLETRAWTLPRILEGVSYRDERGEVDFVVIDCIQLVKYEDQLTDVESYRERVMGLVCHELKILAKELQIPVLVLSQVNRGIESRPNKRPLLSDLRESGALVDVPDVVAFLYRDEMYHADSADCGTAEVILAKIRGDGAECRTIHLGFGGKNPRFSNL